MSRTSLVAQSILAFNRGRDPQRLQRKFELLRREPFAFFRGTCHLFYSTLPRTPALSGAPPVLACGDLHIENFGTYKGDNRLVYFDLNDFDEAALAPFTLDLVRFVTSVLVAAAQLTLSSQQAAKLCVGYIETYRKSIDDGKARWIERTTADGMVKDLLHSLEQSRRSDLLGKRTQLARTGRRLNLDNVHTLAASPAACRRITALVRRFAAGTNHPEFYRLLDVAQRVAGNGSLGVERYVLLVEGKGSPDNNYLLDLKLAIPSSLAPVAKLRQPKWAGDACRVVATQRIVQAISPARLHAIMDGRRSYVLKELQPTADRLDLAMCHGKMERLESVMTTMAEVTAWGHLRGCARHGAAGVEELQRFAGSSLWDKALLAVARDSCEQIHAQWHAYCQAYDDGQFSL